MDIDTTAGDEIGDEETEKWEGPTPRQRAWSNCIAFLATILVIVGELSSEQNLIALIVIGGGLAVLNVLITASNLEKANEIEQRLENNHSSSFEDITGRKRHSSRRRRQDMTSIDLDELSFEDEDDIRLYNNDLEKVETYSLLPRHPTRARSYYRRWYDIGSEAEARQTRHGKPKKKARRETRYEDEEERTEIPPRRSKYDDRDRKSRSQKVRKERHDRVATVERYRERDKRESKRRDSRHKKKKRVTIAAGSQEHVVIGEV